MLRTDDSACNSVVVIDIVMELSVIRAAKPSRARRKFIGCGRMVFVLVMVLVGRAACLDEESSHKTVIYLLFFVLGLVEVDFVS